MQLAIKELRLNSGTHVAMFDRANNTINVYPKSKSGRALRNTSKGWDVAHEIATDNNTSVSAICKRYNVSVFANCVSFRWH